MRGDHRPLRRSWELEALFRYAATDSIDHGRRRTPMWLCPSGDETMSPRANKPSGRSFRWLQFRLGTLLLAVTLFGIWLGIEVNRANRQKVAVARIHDLLGIADYDYQRDKNGNRIADAQPRGPKWLLKWIGEDYFCQVVIVDLSYDSHRRRELGLSVSDDSLRCLESLPAVHTLEIGHAQRVTDAGLIHLRSLKKLRMLYLYDTSITGAGFVHLKRLPSLKGLQLNRTPLTSEGISNLAQLTGLEGLVLAETPLNDADLAALEPLTRLKRLQLHKTNITDAGLAHLERLVNLEQLTLPAEGVSVEGLRQLQLKLPKCQMGRVN